MSEEQNAFLIGGVLLRIWEQVNCSCYVPLHCRKLKINEELYIAVHIVPYEISHIDPATFSQSCTVLRRRTSKGMHSTVCCPNFTTDWRLQFEDKLSIF